MKLLELDYARNSASLFNAIALEPWSIFLDSGYPMIDSGRYDIMAARPYKTFVTCANETEIRVDGRVERTDADPFLLVKDHLGEIRTRYLLSLKMMR